MQLYDDADDDAETENRCAAHTCVTEAPSVAQIPRRPQTRLIQVSDRIFEKPLLSIPTAFLISVQGYLVPTLRVGTRSATLRVVLERTKARHPAIDQPVGQASA